MSTPSAAQRASRRNASSAARKNAPAAQDVPDVLEGVVTEDAESAPSEAQGASTPTPQSPSTANANLSRQRDPGAAPRSMPLAVIDEDLTRRIDQSDLIMPKLRISQAMSATNRRFAETRGKEGVAMGSWYHSTTGKDLGSVVFFVPVDMRKSRALFIQGQGLVCRSFDMLHGEGDPGIECEGTVEERHSFPESERGCALRLWNREGERNVPPPCGMTYNFPGLIIVDIDNPDTTEVLTAMLQLRSTGTKAARNIITQVMDLGAGVWPAVIMELTVESKSNTKGTFYTPLADFYDTTDTMPDKIQRRAKAFARQIGASDLRTSIEPDDND